MKNSEVIYYCYSFNDMHSGGSCKLSPYELIYIEETSRDKAIEVFQTILGRDPENVTCDCCGEDYSISKSENLTDATLWERNRNDEPTTVEDYLLQKEVKYIPAGIIVLGPERPY